MPIVYTKAIKDLEMKRGFVYTLDECQRIGEKAAADLSDDDLIVLGYFGGEKAATEAQARRARALAPLVPEPTPAKPRTSETEPFVSMPTLLNVLEIYGKGLADGLVPLLREIKTLQGRINALEAAQHRMETGVKDLFDGPTHHLEIQ